MKKAIKQAQELLDKAMDQRTRPSEEEADRVLKALYALEENYETNVLIEQIEMLME